MNNILKKLTSRKLWMAIAGVAAGIAMYLGADTNDIGTIAGAVTTIASVLGYIIMEGKIDATGVKNAIESAQKAAEVIEK